MDEDEARCRRAEERRKRIEIAWVPEGTNDDVCPVRGDEARALVGQLTQTGWQRAGRSFPTYSRADIPVRFADIAALEDAANAETP